VSFSSSHFLFPRDFLGTIAVTDIINTPPEPFRPTDVPFEDYKTETKDIGGIFSHKIDFWLYSHHLANKNYNKCRPIHPTKVAAKKNIFLI